ncbi:MAG TPA: DinB family protein, partial [Candidatus Limnocylindria bacterium]|nr:DinB family protein [Candidatus Limnocylindria bacterium]
MRRPCLWPAPALVLVVGLTGLPSAPLRAQTAVSDSAEFAAWRQVQQADIDALRKKFMALAKAVPADKLAWRPMEGTRSFREVFAHVAAEGNTETAMFGRPLPPGSLADFDAEEARLKKLPDDQLIPVMDRAMQSLSTTLGGLSRATLNSPIKYYGQSTLPRVAATYTLNDLHEHLGQLVAYARMNSIVPPW